MSCSTYKYLISGVVLGIGVACIGTGAAMWGLASMVNGDFDQAPHLSDDYESLLSSGQTFAVAGDGIFIGGAALAIVGTILMIVWDPAPSASDVVSDSKGLSMHFSPTSGGLAVGATFRF